MLTNNEQKTIERLATVMQSIPVDHHGLHVRVFRKNGGWEQRRIQQQLQHIR